MTMLEKMARAMYDHRASFHEGCWVEGPENLDLASVGVDGQANLIEMMRAALLAIREPQDVVCEAIYHEVDRDDAYNEYVRPEAWTAGVDAIISQFERQTK